MDRRLTMADLYQHMKEVLQYFGLPFAHMNKVTVVYHPDAIEYIYENQSIKITHSY